MSRYEDLIAAKSARTVFDGITPGEISPRLFPHARDLAGWALRKGRAAVFADTGLAKTSIEVEWARHVAERGRVLILAPLAVAQQIVTEADKRIGLEIHYARQDNGERIVVTNYEMLHAFEPGDFSGIVLDESSILKSFTGATRNDLIERFKETPYRLCATATPAPNDHTELGNHSEFLGIKTRTEMLAEYFAHDGGSTADWRIKGHAVDAFWRWVATWGAVIKSPSDLGHDASGFKLPPLVTKEHVIPIDDHDAAATGFLFPVESLTLGDQRATRRATIAKRVALAGELCKGKDQAIVWCELNDEADAAASDIVGAIQVSGSDSVDDKIERLTGFVSGKYRVLVTKASIAGFGLNLQNCHRMIFLGASHSYEQTYQSIRRCWRFGQKLPVEVHMLRAETDGAILQNYRRKEADAERMAAAMMEHMGDAVRAEVLCSTAKEWNSYEPGAKMIVPSWMIQEGVN